MRQRLVEFFLVFGLGSPPMGEFWGHVRTKIGVGFGQKIPIFGNRTARVYTTRVWENSIVYFMDFSVLVCHLVSYANGPKGPRNNSLRKPKPTSHFSEGVSLKNFHPKSWAKCCKKVRKWMAKKRPKQTAQSKKTCEGEQECKEILKKRARAIVVPLLVRFWPFPSTPGGCLGYF